MTIKDYLLMGLPTVLVVLFICLKITGYITWSWWWVISPLWIPSVVLSLAVILAAVWFMFKLIITTIFINE